MATPKQKKIAKLIIENSQSDNPKTGAELVANSGYGPSMKLYPKRVIDSEGVREELTNLGFSEEGAKSVVQEILYNEKVQPSDRLKAADQVFKIHGSYAAEKKDISTLGESLNTLSKEDKDKLLLLL